MQILNDESNYELTLTGEFHLILNIIYVGNKKIEKRYVLTALLFTLNDHATRIRQATEEVRDVHKLTQNFKYACMRSVKLYSHKCC